MTRTERNIHILQVRLDDPDCVCCLLCVCGCCPHVMILSRLVSTVGGWGCGGVWWCWWWEERGGSFFLASCAAAGLCCAVLPGCCVNITAVISYTWENREPAPSPRLLAVNCAKWCCLSCPFSRWPTSKVQPFTRWLLLTASLLFCDCGHCAGCVSSPPAAWPFPLKGWKPWKWRIEQFYECSSQLFSWLAPATGGSEEI